MVHSSPSAKPSESLTSAPDSARPAQDTTPVLAKDPRPVTVFERWGRSPLQFGSGMTGGIGGIVVGGGIGALLGGTAGFALATTCQDNDSTDRNCGKLLLATTAAGAFVGAILCLPIGVGSSVHRSSSKQVRNGSPGLAIAGAGLGTAATLIGLKLAKGGDLSDGNPWTTTLWILAGSSAGSVLMDRHYAERPDIRVGVWQPRPDAMGLLAEARF